MIRRTRRGAEALEFALVLPVWVLLVLGSADFGWLYFHRTALDSAANTGCRAGALLDPGEDEVNISANYARVEERALAALEGMGAPCAGECSVAVAAFGAAPGRSLRCELDRDFRPLIGFVVDDLRMQAVQVARMEVQR